MFRYAFLATFLMAPTYAGGTLDVPIPKAGISVTLEADDVESGRFEELTQRGTEYWDGFCGFLATDQSFQWAFNEYSPKAGDKLCFYASGNLRSIGHPFRSDRDPIGTVELSSGVFTVMDVIFRDAAWDLPKHLNLAEDGVFDTAYGKLACTSMWYRPVSIHENGMLENCLNDSSIRLPETSLRINGLDVDFVQIDSHFDKEGKLVEFKGYYDFKGGSFYLSGCDRAMKFTQISPAGFDAESRVISGTLQDKSGILVDLDGAPREVKTITMMSMASCEVWVETTDGRSGLVVLP